MEEVVWGMIGCGDVTEKKTGPALYKANGSRLKGVTNRTVSKAEDWVARHGHGLVYQTVDDLLADAEIKAVYIATPPASHYDYAIKALKAGKIPLIEKPMASTYAECLAILETAEEIGLPVYVNFYRRGLEKMVRIKELLSKEVIGKPLTVEIQHFQKPAPNDTDTNPVPWRLTKEAGGGKALDVQVHVLDYLSYFFGNITVVSGVVENLGGLYEVEDTTSASFQFETGVVGSAVWCYVSNRDVDRVTITGTTGTLEFSGTGATDLVVNGEELAFESPEHIAMPFMQSVIDEIRGLAESPANTIQAAHVISIFDELFGAFRERE